jgi:excisionase family DNA binding protein
MQMQKTLVKDLVTIREAAEKLGISRSAVYLAIKEDRLPAVQIGPNLFVHVRDLADYEPHEQAIAWGKNPKRL